MAQWKAFEAGIQISRTPSGVGVVAARRLEIEYLCKPASLLSRDRDNTCASQPARRPETDRIPVQASQLSALPQELKCSVTALPEVSGLPVCMHTHVHVPVSILACSSSHTHEMKKTFKQNE